MTPAKDTVDIDQALDIVVAALGGSRRDGQHTMAAAVTKAMTDGRHLVVQAGTGTGKSLGYLVPAIVRAAQSAITQGQGRTVVATATLALQRQLVEVDLPLATVALESALGRRVTFAVSKGRSNYVCREKMNRDSTSAQDDDDGALFEAPSTRLGRQAKKLREWMKSTDTGDRDDFVGELDPRLWRSVSVTGRECVGAAKCVYGEQCFAEAARERAAASDIVVTNHALLVIDVVEGLPILPEHDVVVIDEAHELVDRTTSALSGSVDAGSIERAAKALRKHIKPDTYDKLFECADDLQGALQALAATVEPPGTTLRLPEVTGTTHTALTALRDVGRAAMAEVTTSSSDEPDVAASKKRAKADLQEVLDTAADLLALDDRSVAWLDTERIPALHHAPLSVAAYLADNLMAQQAVVLTSATLQVNGSMAPVAHSVGLSDENFTSLDVGSPFDYAKQGILYCAAHLPAPSSQGTSLEMLEELGDLIDAAGGRTLALFSSWRGVERAAEALLARFAGNHERELIVAQRGDSIGELVERFRSRQRSSLLGTVSLWQGIDVPGDTCTLVTIDRIPFPRPDDPVMAARSARVDAGGGSGFVQVSVPKAALLLAQGVGRLIRTVDDKGVVAILDSRLATKGYGSTLRASLPPLWYTTDKSTVENSLRNLDV